MRLWVVWVCEHEPLGIQLGDPCVYHVLVVWGSTVKSSRAHTHTHHTHTTHTHTPHTHTPHTHTTHNNFELLIWVLKLMQRNAKEGFYQLCFVEARWQFGNKINVPQRSTTFPNVPQRFRMLQVLIAWDECRERKGWRRTLYRALPRSTRPGNGLRFVPWEGTKKSAKIWRNQGPNFVPIDFPLKQFIKIIKVEFCGV